MANTTLIAVVKTLSIYFRALREGTPRGAATAARAAEHLSRFYGICPPPVAPEEWMGMHWHAQLEIACQSLGW